MDKDKEDIEILFKIMEEIEREKRCVPDFNHRDTMKLLLCTKCTDIFNLKKEMRICKCGESSGKYLEDGKHAEYHGKHAIPIGIGNSDIVKAIKMAKIENKHQKTPTTCKGVGFKSFVILDCATTIKTTQ